MRKTKGRPKSFDDKEVITLAMNYFWEHGYASSSLDELLKAMNISKGSFYHVFKSKEELFTKTIELYRAEQFSFLDKLKKEVGVKKMMLQLVEMTLHELKETGKIKGCLLMNSGKECYGRYPDLSNQIKNEYIAMQEFFAQSIAEGQKNGEISQELEAHQISTRFMNSLNGLVLSVQAGATEQMIESVVEQLNEILK